MNSSHHTDVERTVRISLLSVLPATCPKTPGPQARQEAGRPSFLGANLSQTENRTPSLTLKSVTPGLLPFLPPYQECLPSPNSFLHFKMQSKPQFFQKAFSDHTPPPPPTAPLPLSVPWQSHWTVCLSVCPTRFHAPHGQS